MTTPNEILIESPLDPTAMLRRLTKLGLQVGQDVSIGIGPTHLVMPMEVLDRIIANFINQSHNPKFVEAPKQPARDWHYIHPSPDDCVRLTEFRQGLIDNDISFSEYQSEKTKLRERIILSTLDSLPINETSFLLCYGLELPKTSIAIANGTERDCNALIHATHPVSPEDLWAREQGITAKRIIHIVVTQLDDADVAKWHDAPSNLPMNADDWKTLLLNRSRA